jgi:hypothetical protein
MKNTLRPCRLFGCSIAVRHIEAARKDGVLVPVGSRTLNGTRDYFGLFQIQGLLAQAATHNFESADHLCCFGKLVRIKGQQLFIGH